MAAIEHNRPPTGRFVHRCLWGGLGLGLVTAAMLAFALIQRTELNPHSHQRLCYLCHEGNPPEGLAPPDRSNVGISPVRYSLLHAQEWVVCRECHIERKQQTHPVGVKARSPIPSGWPLDIEGRLMCSTCHEVHRMTAVANQQVQVDMLRGNVQAKQFCQLCHGSLSQTDLQLWHILTTSAAHGETQEQGAISPGMLDPISVDCLSCHDGSIASQAAVKMGRKSVGVNIGSSHPINVRYPTGLGASSSGSWKSGYRAISAIDPRIRLFNGKVGCGSCHNPYSNYPYFIVIEHKRGNLCLACHVK